MTELDILHLNLNISISDGTDEEIDHITRRLLKELRDLDVEYAKLVKGKTPEGTMGADAATVGAIALAVLPAMLPKVLEFLQSWSLQGKGRTIKFKGKIANQQVEFEGSFVEMEKLIGILEKKQKKSKK